MPTPHLGRALLFSGIALVLTTLAADYAHDAGWLTPKLQGDGYDYTDQLRQERSGPFHAKTWDVRKYGYVAGTVGLFMILVGAPKREERS